jgi:hypothetical protein
VKQIQKSIIMKQSMKVVAMVAFLGCFAIVVIAAGSGKARYQEDCGEEWKKGFRHEDEQPTNTSTLTHSDCMAMSTKENKQELILPVGLLHTTL